MSRTKIIKKTVVEVADGISITCDICFKEIKKSASVSLNNQAVISTFVVGRYGKPPLKMDVCGTCSRKIISFLDTLRGKPVYQPEDFEIGEEY